jgi:hypothetical protein
MLSLTEHSPVTNGISAADARFASAMSTRRSCGTSRYINGVNVKHPPLRPRKEDNAPSSGREHRSSHITRPEAQFIPEMSRSSPGRLHPEQRHLFRARYPKHACPRSRAIDSKCTIDNELQQTRGKHTRRQRKGQERKAIACEPAAWLFRRHGVMGGPGAM